MRLLTEWPARFPRTTLILAALLTIAAVLSMLRLRPETSIQGLLDESQPAVAAMGRVLDQFPVANELLVLATLPEGAQPDAQPLIAFAEALQRTAATDADGARLIARMRYRAGTQERQYIEKVVVPAGLYYLNDEQFAAVMQRLSPAGMREQIAQNEAALAAPGPAIGALAKAIARDPLRLYEFLLQRLSSLNVPGGGGGGGGGGGATPGSNGAFLSPDNRSLLIRIEGVKPTGDFSFATDITAAVRRLTAAANADGLRIDIAGGYAVASHSATMIRRDSIVGVVSTVVGLAVLFALLYRRPVRLFILAFAPVACGIVWGFGAYALFRDTITPLAAVVGGALGGIGIDYTIHYVIAYFARRQGQANSAAVAIATSRRLLSPMVAACLTSIIGFITIAISPVPVLRDFAMVGTLCLTGSWLAATVVLPALLAWRDNGTSGIVTLRLPVAAMLGGALSNRPRTFIAAASLVLLAAAACLAVGGAAYRSEADLTSLHPRPNPPLDAQRFIATRMQSAAGPIVIYLNAPSADELVRLSHDVQRRLDTPAVRAAGISGVFGLASLVPDPAVVAQRQPMLSEALADRVTADFQTAIAASSFDPAGFAGYRTFLSQLLSPGDAPTAASLVRYPELGQLLLPRDALAGGPIREAVTVLFFREPLDRSETRDAALRAIGPALAGMPGATITGMTPISANVEAAVLRDLPRLIAAALGAIGIYLALQFRSLKLALLAMLPTCLSLLCVLAFMSITDTRLNLVNSVMAPLLLGINVDYGIFVATVWRQSRDRRELEEHFAPLATALLTCCATTFIGFGSMVPASIPAVQSLGLLINVGVTACAAATLLLIWPMMLMVKGEMRSDE
ncbi:MAG TPA: MMPL family transporter [Tepidisphaeraceae bacterium]|jgi:hypothetical protein|nr:MMPL family transporter [Tepidisphaeraceae bacterium]